MRSRDGWQVLAGARTTKYAEWGKRYFLIVKVGCLADLAVLAVGGDLGHHLGYGGEEGKDNSGELSKGVLTI